MIRGMTAMVAFMSGIISQRRWPGVFDPVIAHGKTEFKKPISGRSPSCSDFPFFPVGTSGATPLLR